MSRHLCCGQCAAALLLVLLLLAVPAPDAGAGWTTLPNAPVAPAGRRHDDIFFVSPTRGWVVNGDGEIFRTTDGGDSWERQLHLPDTYFRSCGFVNEEKGWVGTLFGNPLLYATTDGGATWTPVTAIGAPQPTGICGIWAVDDSVAYACGRYDAPARVIKTTNGGATWQSFDLSASARSAVDCFFFDRDHGFVVGGRSDFATRQSVVMATTDGGASWATRYVGPRLGEWCWKISFPTPAIGYVSLERHSGPAYFLRTTDGGATWQDLFFRASFEEQGIGFVTPDLGWIGGWPGETYETTDGGAFWHLADFGVLINRFRFLGPNLGYAVGETVYKYTGDPAAVAGGEPAPPAARLVAESHPNPFRGMTSLAYTLPREADVTLRIHDVQGRTIRALIPGRQLAGRHEWTWDGRDATGAAVGGGVYWYRVEANGESAVKKLVVVH